MKIRTGFVSNSSSSSFIVYFDKVPNSKDELREFLFGNDKHYYGLYDDEQYSTDYIAEIVWNDMRSGPANLKSITETIKSGTPINNHVADDIPSFNHYVKPGTNEKTNWQDRFDEDAYDKALNKFYEKYIKQIDKNAVKENRAYIFSYSDNDSAVGCAMEHADLFTNLKHQVISRH